MDTRPSAAIVFRVERTPQTATRRYGISVFAYHIFRDSRRDDRGRCPYPFLAFFFLAYVQIVVIYRSFGTTRVIYMTEMLVHFTFCQVMELCRNTRHGRLHMANKRKRNVRSSTAAVTT